LAACAFASFVPPVLGAGPPFPTAVPLGQCSTTSGVILAVDFSHWGGPVLRSCGSVPTTGMTLLNQGGWHSTGTHHDGPAFVCRISYSGFRGGADYPTVGAPDYQACVSTPPTTAYWSYWHAAPGKNSWTYSQSGAASYHPQPGSVDLWTFGGTNTGGTSGGPAFSPDSVRARNTAPGGGSTSAPPAQHSSTPPASAPGTPAGTAGGGAGTSSGGSDSGMSHGPANSASSAGTSRAGTTPSATPTASTPGSSSASNAAGLPRSSSGGPQIMDAAPAAATRHSAGSSRPVVLAGGLVLVLGGAAGVTGWRRRQAR
ncbi:MAG: hypothetical protein ACR2N4_02035, partial [Jatrophihabitans sp.]